MVLTVHIVLDCNFDDLVARKIGTNRSVLAASTNLVGLVGLLPVHTKAILMTVYCDCMQ